MHIAVFVFLVLNIILNILRTPILGVLGASIATTICYFEVWVIRYWHSKRFVRLKINLLRDSVSYMLLIVQAIVLLVISEDKLLYGVETAVFLLIILLYVKDILQIMKKGRTAVAKKIEVCKK